MSFKPDNFTVWFELPVTDIDKAIAFYSNVFQTEMNRVDDMGPNPIAFFPTADDKGVGGHLYPGKPAADGNGPTIHLACPDTLEATAERFKEAGGAVLSDPVTIPAGRFIYAVDPDGNSIGLFAA
ncbi:MAG: VOC family protein [Roseibium sp.]|nr:VOC family protein [Roseibium sp.]